VKRRFHQLDVFSAVPLMGNPLAVVHAADGLSDATMAAFARWTNLSETTFLLPPRDPAADYRVRIFTPGGELPFAGHPTLGSCWAWLAGGGQPKESGTVVQECAVGLVRIRRSAASDGGRLAFAAPPLRRSGPLEPELLQRILAATGLQPGDVLQHQWVDNGPGWCAVLLRSAAEVLALQVDATVLGNVKLGLVGAYPAGAPCAFEVRALFHDGPLMIEDPVTGSLNASLAQWLIGAGLAPTSYVAGQGAVLQRDGRVHIVQDGNDIWVGGDVVACIAGDVDL
jgi:PhzF family phenazine biosynthesis protein